jgi:hypothetical protein
MKKQKFKVGDRVRRISREHAGMKPGDEGTVCRVIDPFAITIVQYGADDGYNHDPECFELVINNKTNVMIDYKIVGTKLPTIPGGTEYRAKYYWSSEERDSILTGDYDDLVSYGSKVFHNETYILADISKYDGDNYFMFKESTIKELAAANQKGEIIGYKLVKEEYKQAALKIADVTTFGVLDGLVDFHIDTPAYRSLKAAGVLDLWFEPVYKKKETIIEDGHGRVAKVVNGKLQVADGELSLDDLIAVRDLSLKGIGTRAWKVTLTSATFNIGCWGDVTLDDINKAIEAM